MISTKDLIKKTMPYILLRIGVYSAIMVGLIIYSLVALWVGVRVVGGMGSGSIIPVLIVLTLFLLGGFGVVKWVERYFLYIIKSGHIYTMTELIENNEIPEGKGQIEYGKDRVVESFGKVNVFFALDALVDGAVRQIERWMMRTASFLDFIPQAKTLISFVSRVIGIALRYVDEAILSYTIKKDNNGKNIWANSADGIVLYVQSWKSILRTSALIVVLNGIVWWGTFFAGTALFSAIITFTGDLEFLNILSFLFGVILSTFIRKALFDPIATAMMLRSYHYATENKEVKVDLSHKLSKVSGKFRELINKGEGR